MAGWLSKAASFLDNLDEKASTQLEPLKQVLDTNNEDVNGFEEFDEFADETVDETTTHSQAGQTHVSSFSSPLSSPLSTHTPSQDVFSRAPSSPTPKPAKPKPAPKVVARAEKPVFTPPRRKTSTSSLEVAPTTGDVQADAAHSASHDGAQAGHDGAQASHDDAQTSHDDVQAGHDDVQGSHDSDADVAVDGAAKTEIEMEDETQTQTDNENDNVVVGDGDGVGVGVDQEREEEEEYEDFRMAIMKRDLEKTRKKNAALENTLQKAKVAVRKSKHEAQEREGELAAALATARMTQDLVDEANEEINALRAAVSAAEAQTASAQSQISDLESQLAAKDVSLAATSESASGKSAQLEAQIEALKSEMAQQVTLAAQERQEAAAREADLEDQVGQVATQLGLARSQAEAASAEAAEAAASLAEVRAALASTKREFTEYQARASSVLQQNKETIAQLQQAGTPSSGNEGLFGGESSAQLKQERDELELALAGAQAQVGQLTTSLEEADIRASAEKELLESQLQSAHEAKAKLEADLQSLRRETASRLQIASAATEEARLAREEAAAAAAAAAKTEASLRAELAAASRVKPEEAELRAQLVAVGDTVYAKQALIEELSSEKQTLMLRLESLEREASALRKGERAVVLPPDVTAVDMPAFETLGNEWGMGTSSSGPRRRFRPTAESLPFLDEHNPDSGPVAKRVGSAARALDSFSLIFSDFFQQYPIARLGLVAYMLFLHIFVFYVLSHTSPTIAAPGPRVRTRTSNTPP